MNIKVEKIYKFSWLILVPFVSAFPSRAAEWSVGANINQSISYDDNVTMREKKEDSFIYNVSPTINFAHKTRVSEVSANAAYGYERFFEKIPGIEQNRHNQRYGIDGKYSMNERVEWGLSADYNIAPGRNSAEEDNGNFDTDSERKAFSIRPSVSFVLTERDSLELSGRYSDTRYTYSDDIPPLRLGDEERSKDDFDLTEWASSSLADGRQSDYDNKSVNLRWSHSWSERFNSSVGFSYSNYESERITSSRSGVNVENEDKNIVEGSPLTTNREEEFTTNDSYSITVSSEYWILENWKVYGEGGGRFADTEREEFVNNIVTNTDDSNWGYLFDIGTEYSDESWVVDFSVGHSFEPSSRGNVEKQFRVGLDLDYQVTERLSAALASSYQKREPEDGGSERTNFMIEPSVSWRISPDWAVSTVYRFRHQKRPIGGTKEKANSNMIMIALNYQWQGLSISR